jgi:hypothetical protein
VKGTYKSPHSRTDVEVDIEGLHKCPKPEASLSDYNAPRLQKSLMFVEKVLAKRDITPRQEHFYQLFKIGLKDALQTDGSKKSHKGAAECVAKFEFLATSNHFLAFNMSEEKRTMQSNVLELRRLQYYARYGDYLKVLPNKIRAHAREAGIHNWQLIVGKHLWTDISIKSISGLFQIRTFLIPYYLAENIRMPLRNL